MSILVTVVLVLIAVCLLLWAVLTFLPGPQPLKNAIAFVIVVALVLWLLRVAGVV